MFRFLTFGSLFAFSCLFGIGQDLGSSNKLFGGTKKKAPASASAKKTSGVSKKGTGNSVKVNSTAKAKKPAAEVKTTPRGKNAAKTPVKTNTITATKTSPKTSKGASGKSAASTKGPPKEAPDKNAAAKQSNDNSTVGSGTAAAEKSQKTASQNIPGIAVGSAEANELFEDLILQGNTARDDRDYTVAEAAYARAAALKPKDSRAVYGLGNLYSDQLRWQEAEKQYRLSIEMTPNDAVAHIALSYVLVQPVTAPNLADRYEEAEKLARRAIELAPANALAFDQLGVSMELRGFIGAETENAYRKAIQLDPAFAPPHAHLGRLLRRRGKAKESATAYQYAIDRSREVGTKILVAEVLQSEQRFADSENLLRAALAEDPKNPTALLLLGRALITNAAFDEAESVFKKALSIGANGFIANSQLAEVYLRQSKPELAENALLQASRFVTDLDRRSLSQSFEAVGDAYMKGGNNRNAERAFKQAITFDGDTEILSGKLSKAQQGRFSPGN